MAVKTLTYGTLTCQQAEGIAAPHCFTTRLGGVSRGHLSSLNIGIHRGDDWENVLKNYEILGNLLGFDPKKAVLSTQTHSDIVRAAGLPEAGAGLYAPELTPCDGLITNTPGLALVVFTADCTPILLWDEKTGAVGAAHAGWRGTAARIGEKAVQAMEKAFGCNPRDIHAAIGPNIGACCFETDEDVPEAMRAALGNEAEAFIRPAGEKYYVDLKGINARILEAAGVGQVEVSRLCTHCDETLFWSHRRTGSLRGSQGAVIVAGEVER